MDQSASGNGDATVNLERKRQKKEIWENESSDSGAVQKDRSTARGPRLWVHVFTIFRPEHCKASCDDGCSE